MSAEHGIPPTEATGNTESMMLQELAIRGRARSRRDSGATWRRTTASHVDQAAKITLLGRVPSAYSCRSQIGPTDTRYVYTSDAPETPNQ